jgi:hypothetical protein
MSHVLDESIYDNTLILIYISHKIKSIHVYFQQVPLSNPYNQHLATLCAVYIGLKI